MRRTVHFVATKKSAFLTIKMTPYNASVRMAIQEILVVCIRIVNTIYNYKTIVISRIRIESRITFFNQ